MYVVEHLATGRVYVGQTRKTFSTRWARHCRDARDGRVTHFAQAIAKYGPAAFSLREEYQCSGHEAMDELERELIRRYDSVVNGFNILLGGKSGQWVAVCKNGHPCSLPEQRTKWDACRECVRACTVKGNAKNAIRYREDPEFKRRANESARRSSQKIRATRPGHRAKELLREKERKARIRRDPVKNEHRKAVTRAWKKARLVAHPELVEIQRAKERLAYRKKRDAARAIRNKPTE